MDVLMSIPIASYLLIPSAALTSWSTSLNIFFFYLTWSSLVSFHDPLHIHIGGVAAIRVVFWLLPSILSLALDVGVPSLAEAIKHGGRSALPPRDAQRLLRSIGAALLNLVIILAVEAGFSYAFSLAFQQSEFTTAMTLPLPWHMAKHIGVMMIAREALVYHINRSVLHSPVRRQSGGVTAYIAQAHGDYAHSRHSPPFSLQLFINHPVPLVLHRLLPTYIPALLMRPHILTYLLFVIICTIEETIAMSGYNIVPGLIMGGIAQRSAIHYASGGTANYGAWGLFDWMYGTSRGRDLLEDVRAEADEHHLGERASHKADQGAGLLQDGVDALSAGSRRSKRIARKS